MREASDQQGSGVCPTILTEVEEGVKALVEVLVVLRRLSRLISHRPLVVLGGRLWLRHQPPLVLLPTLLYHPLHSAVHHCNRQEELSGVPRRPVDLVVVVDLVPLLWFNQHPPVLSVLVVPRLRLRQASRNPHYLLGLAVAILAPLVPLQPHHRSSLAVACLLLALVLAIPLRVVALAVQHPQMVLAVHRPRIPLVVHRHRIALAVHQYRVALATCLRRVALAVHLCRVALVRRLYRVDLAVHRCRVDLARHLYRVDLEVHPHQVGLAVHRRREVSVPMAAPRPLQLLRLEAPRTRFRRDCRVVLVMVLLLLPRLDSEVQDRTRAVMDQHPPWASPLELRQTS